MMSRGFETSRDANPELECTLLSYQTNISASVPAALAASSKQHDIILPQASPTLTPDSLPAAIPNPKLNALATYFPCRHTTSTKFETSTFCKDCGARMYKVFYFFSLFSSKKLF